MKILILTDLYQHSICHDRFFEAPYLDKDIIKKNLGTDIYLWGPGIDDEPINWEETADVKIEKTFGDKYYFDIIIQLPGGGILDTSFYCNENSKTLIFIHFHEIPNDIDLNIIKRLNPHIIFYISNENAIDRFFSNEFSNKVIGAFPMYQSENLAKRFYDVAKDIDVLMIGNSNEKIYPDRKRLAGIMNKLDKKYKVFHKPTISYNNISVEDVIKTYPNTLNESISQTDEYNKLINSSKIVLCSSHAKIAETGVKHSNFRLRKFSEIGMSSALRIGSNSDEDHYSLNSSNYIDVENISDDKIIEKISYLLDNDTERNNLVVIQNEYEKEFTACKFIEKIIYCYNMYKLKKFGYYNFTAFRMIY